MDFKTILKNHSSGFTAVIKLVTGRVIAQAIAILIMPVLTRLYSPEGFGTLALYVSIISIVGTVACGRYEQAIMLPQEHRNAASLFWLSLIITVATSVLVFLATCFLGKSVGEWLRSPGIDRYLWVVPFSVLGVGSYLALNYWCSRKKAFGRLSVSRVIQSSSNQGTKLCVGLITGGSAWGLVAGKVLSDIFTSLTLMIQVFRDDMQILKQGFKWSRLKSDSRRYRRFFFFDGSSALLNTFSRNLPPFMLAYFFGPSIVGFFALSHRMLSLPMSILGQSVSQVYFQKAVNAKHHGDLAQLTERVFRRITVLGLFPILMLMVVGPEVFSTIFGKEWREAGVYFSILCPWILFQFLSSPLSYIFSVLETQQKLFLFNSILLVSRVFALLIGGMSKNPIWAMGFLSGSGATLYFWLCIWNLRNSGIRYRNTIGILSRYFLMSTPGLALLLCAKYSQLNEYLIIALIPVSFMCFYVIVLKYDSQLIYDFLGHGE